MRLKFIGSLLFLAFFVTLNANCVCSNPSQKGGLKPLPSINKPSDYGNWADETIKRLNIYLGSHKNRLKTEFGDPARIRKNVVYKRNNYDEEWYYHQSKGIPFITETSWAYSFFIIDDVVVYVDVF